MVETFDDYDAAVDAADPDTEMVCGTYLLDGVTPKYFVLSKDTPDHVGRDTAFQIRNGRPPSQYERWLVEIAEDLHEVEQERVDA